MTCMKNKRNNQKINRKKEDTNDIRKKRVNRTNTNKWNICEKKICNGLIFLFIRRAISNYFSRAYIVQPSK